MQVGEELLAYEVAEVVAGKGGVMVEFAILILGCGPGFPTIEFVEDVGVLLSLQLGFVGSVLFESFEVLQEEEPGGLLRVVQLSSAASFFEETVVNIFERLLELGSCNT